MSVTDTWAVLEQSDESNSTLSPVVKEIYCIEYTYEIYYNLIHYVLKADETTSNAKKSVCFLMV